MSNQVSRTKVQRGQETLQNWVPGYSNEVIAASLMNMEHELAWQRGASLDQVRFKRVGGEWQVMVKAHKGTEYGVCFLNCRTFAEAVEILGFRHLKDKLVWRRDKYAGR